MRELLDECLNLSRKIREKDEQIIELKSRIASPKNQIITDMPKGGKAENAIENYLLKLERLQISKKTLEYKRNLLWNEIKIELFNCKIYDKEIRHMLYLRFYRAFSWNKCAEQLKIKYQNSNWNTNKCFRVYRQTLNKLHKNYD